MLHTKGFIELNLTTISSSNKYDKVLISIDMIDSVWNINPIQMTINSEVYYVKESYDEIKNLIQEQYK